MPRHLKLTPLAIFCACAVASVASQAATAYADVISSTPVSATVSVPRQVCSDEQRWVQPAPSGAGAVIGAIAGGVIGNNFGSGFGRAAATGLGAVAGASVGNAVEANANPPTEVPVRRCQTVASYETRTVGYDVVYEFNGQRYSTRLAQDPGKRLAVDVRPQALASAARPVPRVADAAALESGVAVATAPEAPLYSAPVYGAPAYYYEARPAYYYDYGAPVVVAPAIGFGIGYWGGRGGHHWR